MRQMDGRSGWKFTLFEAFALLNLPKNGKRDDAVEKRKRARRYFPSWLFLFYEYVISINAALSLQAAGVCIKQVSLTSIAK